MKAKFFSGIENVGSIVSITDKKRKFNKNLDYYFVHDNSMDETSNHIVIKSNGTNEVTFCPEVIAPI